MVSDRGLFLVFYLPSFPLRARGFFFFFDDSFCSDRGEGHEEEWEESTRSTRRTASALPPAISPRARGGRVPRKEVARTGNTLLTFFFFFFGTSVPKALCD